MLRAISLSIFLTLYLLLAGCENSRSRAPVVAFSGVCDGSAAVRIGRQQILVASDETNELTLFDSRGGARKQIYSLNGLLSDDAEMDLEAGVVHDGGIWWIGSHGRDAKAEVAPNRNVLFKTAIPDRDLKIELLSEIHDLSDLIANSVDDKALALAPKNGGVNIEGMSVTKDGDLLIALRSPLTEGLAGNATIIQLSWQNNAFEVVETYRLDLGNRGVRDLVITDNGYLLIAGDVASGGEFSVFRWRITGELEELFVVPEGINAEALVDMGQDWLLLSDDGKVKRADEQAQDGDRLCENIVLKNTAGSDHSGVFFRGLSFSP